MNFISLQSSVRSVELFHDDFPTLFECWDNNYSSHSDDSKFGYLFHPATIVHEHLGKLSLQGESYFCLSGQFTVRGGRGFAVSRQGHKAMNVVGGPVEELGRLKYIDGCTDSLLISPVKLGDPCFNHLHFPPNIQQTMHTHPSNRIGAVIRGKGRCVTPEGEIPLSPGMLFCIPKDGNHCFFTDDSTMDVVAWHPDSDYGPLDENHPMLNRTIVDGVSARFLDEIRTK